MFIDKFYSLESINESEEQKVDNTEEKKRNSKKIYQDMIDLIKNRDLMRAIQFMTSMRKTAHVDRGCNSVYRELLFLALSQLGPDGLDIGKNGKKIFRCFDNKTLSFDRYL